MHDDIRLSTHLKTDNQRDIKDSLEDDGIPEEFKHFTSNLGTN
jgi:hypothetical protein